MVVGNKGMEIKTIEKPVIKKRKFKYVQDEEGEDIKEEVSRDSDKLELTILDEVDPDEVNFNMRKQ